MATDSRKQLSRRLADPPYARFPFRIGPNGAVTSARPDHVREQIEQVLFTDPGERVFRPEFGAGVRAFVFEPNASVTWEVLRKRLTSSLNDALQGEVDPRTLNVDISSVEGAPERLLIVITYTLAAVGVQQQFSTEVNAGETHG